MSSLSSSSSSSSETEDPQAAAAGPFGEAEYANSNGMITTVWGPALWHFLHTMSFNFPVNPTAEDRKRYRNFVLSLRDVLPCGKCRANLRTNLRALPLRAEHLRSREAFSRYVFELHELVNRMLEKPSGLTYEEVRDTYEHFRARCNTSAATHKESGCTEPRYVGKKPQCLLHIVPRSDSLARSRRHLRVRKDCLKRKVNT